VTQPPELFDSRQKGLHVGLKDRLAKTKAPKSDRPGGERCRVFDCREQAQVGGFLCKRHAAEMLDKLRGQLLD